MAQRQLTNADGEAVGDQAAKANQPAPLEERKAELLRALEVLKPYGDSAEEVREQEVASEPASGGRRLRIELGASRRLLFGSLGLKPPKNKADEEKIKQQLMKDVRPVKNARLTESGESVSGKGADTSEAGLEDWRPYVTYRAVECCRDGVVLSEPPFPFKQRWDPQQRGRKKGKRGRASQDFSLNEHYDEDDDSGLYMDEDPGWARGTKGRKSETPRRAQRSEAWEHEGQSKMATEEAAVDDLPCVPGDVGSLPEAQADGLTEGMVITWKQMTMSKATRWQPQMVQRTGRVLAGSDAANVHVVLATRDREDRRKMYDQKTGERVYDKFEVPDSEGDGEDDGEDDGKRTVSWAELLDPRVLQGPPAPATTAAAGEGGQDEATKAVGERQAEAEGVQA
ncbi:hypothetical protein CDD83_1178 [Cordyceps sp. RAO-2017]|nr:hypothetical protein CDD83_1178 [Cordyceps sp. RAO-2017]